MYISGILDIAHAIKEVARSILAVARALDRVADKLPEKEVSGDA